MDWLNIAITFGGYIASAVVYIVNSRKQIFTQEQIKEMKEGLAALSDGLKNIKKQ